MSQDIRNFVKSVVELLFSSPDPQKETEEDTRRIERGVIIRVDRQMYVVSLLAEDYQQRKGKRVTVNIFQDNQVVFSFPSVILNAYEVQAEKKRLFVLQIPVEYQPITKRAKPRVDTKAPGLINIHSLKGTIFPFLIRKKEGRIVILDVSETGAQIATNLALPKEMRISLSFSLKEGERIALDSDILWCKTDGGLYRYGLRFVSPSPQEQSLLRKIVLSDGTIIDKLHLRGED